MAAAEVAGWAIAAFLSGLALAGGRLPPFYFWLAAAALGVAAWLTHRRIWIAPVILPALLAGIAYYGAYFRLKYSGWNLPAGEFSAVVVTEPQFTKTGSQAEIILNPPHRGRMLAWFPAAKEVNFGDKLRGQGSIFPAAAEKDLPRIMFRGLEITAAGRGNPAVGSLLRVKTASLDLIRRALPAKEASFMEGVLLGYRNDFSEGLQTDMKLSGTTHLVALSGYNISILVLAVHSLFLGLLSRRQAFFLVAAAVLLFSILAGAESSIVRAAVMGLALLLAKVLGRPGSFGLAMLWAAFGMTLWNPGALFEAGFLLSFASLLGIAYVAPAIQAAANFRGKWPRFFEFAAMTLGAQLAALPVIAAVFGNFSWLAFPANILILPLIPVLMGLGFALLGVLYICPSAAGILGVISEPLLKLVLGLMHFFAGLSAPVNLALIPAWAVAAYACALGIFSFAYARKK